MHLLFTVHAGRKAQFRPKSSLSSNSVFLNFRSTLVQHNDKKQIYYRTSINVYKAFRSPKSYKVLNFLILHLTKLFLLQQCFYKVKLKSFLRLCYNCVS